MIIKRNILHAVISLFFIFSGISTSNVFSTPPNNINLIYQHYTTENGLSQNYVDCIFKDSRGFIWVGTWDGLNRFDGYNFITYRHNADNNSISDGFINAITEDKNGNLWIATRNGINKFIFNEEKFIHFQKDTSQLSISDSWISTVMFDTEDNLWIGTLTAGVEKLVLNEQLTKIESVKRFDVDFWDEKSTTSENIYCIIQDHAGYIFVGSILGLDRIDPKTGIISKYTDLNHPFYFEPTVVHSLFEDSQQILWIGTESGILSIDHKNKKLTRYPVDRVSIPGSNKYALSHGLVKSINEDSYGHILIGTLGGLHKYNKKTGEFYLFPSGNDDNYSLNNNFINEVLCDENKNVWIGTEKGGLNKYNDNQKKFYFFSHNPQNKNSLNNNIINSLYEDEKNIWIGTAGGGLNRYIKNQSKFHHYTHHINNKNSISLDFISAITGKNNELWVGTWGSGLNRGVKIPNSENISFKTHMYSPEIPDGPPFIYISSMVYDKHNNLWIGRPDGLFIYDQKNSIVHLVNADKTFGNNIRDVGCLYFDTKNNLWVGTTVGLYRIKVSNKNTIQQLCNPDTVYLYKHIPGDSTSLSSDFIVSILEDKTGNMWFSTYGNGISRLEELYNQDLSARFSFYNQSNGLSNNVVYGMLEDQNNNLWLSTDRGLTKYNYKNKNTTVYYESDGLQSNQFYWSAYYKNDAGLMYFGGTKGVNFFYPDSIHNNEQEPKVVVTDFKLFNQSQSVGNSTTSKLRKTISETTEIELEYNENILSFEFSSLCYFAPEKNQYQYKMEGFDANWTTTTSDRRYVTYTNLNPGTYYFKVKGSNNDGIWNETPTSIKLIIKPPWWKTILFRVLFIVVIATFIILFFRLRLRNLNLKKIQLEQLVQERTKELNESNNNLKVINTTKDKLFAIVAHDLKNPFNVILGMFGLLVRNYDKYSDDKKKELLSAVNKSSIQLYKLLENLLQWSRAQSGSIVFNPSPFVIQELIHSNIKISKEQAREKNLEIECICNNDIIVYADIDLTNAILRNLINNAIKFTSQGCIKIHVNKINKKQHVEIRVADTGNGIDPKEMENLFKLGGVNSTKGTQGESGTGLGLMLCSDFAHKNGGEIWAESEVGKGSSFIFTLPLFHR